MSYIKIDLEKALSEKVISSEIFERLLSFQKKESPDTGSRFVQIFSVFGSLVTGLWVILLIAANWDGISDMMKTIIMIGSTILTYVIAYYFSYRNIDYPKTWQAIMFLGSMFYGAAIILLGQIYNLGWSFDQALLVWALGVFPLAYLTGFISLFLLAITLFYAYVFARLTNSWDIPGFFIANVFILVGMVSLLISRWHFIRSYEWFGRILSWTGMLAFLGGLLAYTFGDFWRYGWSSWSTGGESSSTTLLAWILLWLAGLAIYIWERWRNTHALDKIDLSVIAWSIAIIGFLVFTTLSIDISDRGSYYGSDPEVYNNSISVLIMNILYLGLLLALIWIGIKRERFALINISMIFLAIYLFGKYLTFVFESKMDGALVFISWGIICLLVTFLVEKIRRRLISTITH